MRHVVSGAVVLLALIGLAGCGGGGGSSSGGTTSTSTDTEAAWFGGLKSIATAGGAAVHLSWDAADDGPGGSVTYQVYAAATTGGHTFASPIATTSSTSIVVTSTNSGLIVENARVFFVVRSTDASGNQDQNMVELACTPVPAANVAFVSDTAGGAGTIGDPTDPFPTLQDGINAAEGAGGGVVLVDADGAGTVYTGELSISVAVTSLGLYGGFPRFSTLPVSPTGAQILATRDVAGNETALSGGTVVLADADLIQMTNGLSPTDVDGFTVRDLHAGSDPVTGTVFFTEGSHRVTGVGTDFSTDLTAGSVIVDQTTGVALDVDTVRSANELVLETPWPLPSTSGMVVERNGAIQEFIGGTDVNLQVSCCRAPSWISTRRFPRTP